MKIDELMRICDENNYDFELKSQYQCIENRNYSREEYNDFKSQYDILINDEKNFKIEISCSIIENHLDYICSISIYYSELEEVFYDLNFLNLLSEIRKSDFQQNIEIIKKEK